MLKELAQYLASVKETKMFEINGENYADSNLYRIAPHVDRPEQITVNSLESIVKLIKKEIGIVTTPAFVQVRDARTVFVFTTYDAYMNRDNLYKAVCNVPEFRGGFKPYEETIIALRSKYIPNDGTAYLLDLLSRVNKENGVSTTDNGVSQTVEARSGISLKEKVSIRPRVSLRPFRTFLEVEQPESEFLLRLDDDGNVGLFEADGGMWELEARRNIADFLSNELKLEEDDGAVVVMS